MYTIFEDIFQLQKVIVFFSVACTKNITVATSVLYSKVYNWYGWVVFPETKSGRTVPNVITIYEELN